MDMQTLDLAYLRDHVVRVNLVRLAQKVHSAAISWQRMLWRESGK